jgi:hypothetical protein
LDVQTSAGTGEIATRSEGWVVPLLAGMGLAAAGLAGAGVWAYRSQSRRGVGSARALAAQAWSEPPSRPPGGQGFAAGPAPGVPLATLHAESGALAGQVFSVTGSPYTIGRGADNNLVVADTPVSRRTAQLALRDNRWYVRALGSSNGTFLNRQPLSGAQPLSSGDLISLGETVLAFAVQPVPGGGAVARPLQPMAAARAARPAAAGQRRGWLVVGIVVAVLILLVLAAVLLSGALKGTTTEPGPSGPGINVPGLPSGLPSLPTGLPALPTGLPELPTSLPELSTSLPVPTGLTLPTGLPGLPTGLPKLP